MEDKKHMKMRKTAVLGIGATGYALLFALGSQIDRFGVTVLGKTVVRFLAALPCAWLILYGLFEKRSAKNVTPPRKTEGKPFCTLGAFLVIFFSYIPAFLVYYPGSVMYDTQRQTFQIAGNAYDAFHPLLHTLMLRFCLSLYGIFQSFEKCIAVYSLLQMTVMAGCFALICASLSRLVSRRAAYLSAAFFCIYPAHAAFALNYVKDGLFSAFFALFLTYCFEMVCGELRRDQKALCVLSGAAACLMRNNMIYALAVWCAAVLLGGKKMHRLLFVSVLSVVLYAAVNEMMIAATHAERGSKAEMLSVPMQQLSRAYRYAPECFSSEDMEEMDALFRDKGYLHYEPTLADHVKYYADVEAYEADTHRAAELWLNIGKKCPNIYLDAFLNTALPFLYPYRTYHVDAPYIEMGIQPGGVVTAPFGQPPLTSPRRFEPIRTGLDTHLWLTGADGHPILRWLFNAGLICWLVLLCALEAAYAGDWKRLVLSLLPVLLWGTYLLGPVLQGRYLYPFVCVLPVVFSGRFTHKDTQMA